MLRNEAFPPPPPTPDGIIQTTPHSCHLCAQYAWRSCPASFRSLGSQAGMWGAEEARGRFEWVGELCVGACFWRSARASEATGPTGLCEDKLGSDTRPCHSPLYLGIAGCFAISFVFPFVGWFVTQVSSCSTCCFSIFVVKPVTLVFVSRTRCGVVYLLQSCEVGKVIFCSLRMRPQVSEEGMRPGVPVVPSQH